MYCIEGNIGAGKSCTMKHLAENFECFMEPLEKWSLLDDFYKDPKTFSGPFQIQVLYTQYEQIKSINRIASSCFIERSPWSSRNVFIKMLKEDDLWMEEYSSAYEKFYEKVEQTMKINKIFMLSLEPQKCYERIHKRNRYEERNLSFDYVKRLDEVYKQALSETSTEVVYVSVDGKTPREVADEIASMVV